MLSTGLVTSISPMWQSATFVSQAFHLSVSVAQVLQLQAASTSPQSQAVDYDTGIEAMVLAILQQTTYSQEIQLADVATLSLLTSQDDAVADGVLLNAYSVYLADALAAIANLTALIDTSLLNATSALSVLPVGPLLRWHMLAVEF